LQEKIYEEENRRLPKNSRLTSETLYGQERGHFMKPPTVGVAARILGNIQNKKEKAV
jgi:hypothetical protein